MGKSKKRIFNKYSGNNGYTLKREDAVLTIISDIKNQNITEKTKNIISLFGIIPEELSEAGVSFEDLSAVNYLFF